MTSHIIKLPFDFNALEPYISGKTVDLHYNKHHQGYATKLQELVCDTEYVAMSLEDIIRTSHANTHVAIYNNAAQIWNHNFYWHSVCAPIHSHIPVEGAFFDAAVRAGGFEKLIQGMIATGMAQFASGWAWLVRDDTGELAIRKTSNADPVWLNSSDTPLLILDVWEHAYYLDYQNRRAEYLDKIISIINWSFAESRFGAAKFYGDLARQER